MGEAASLFVTFGADVSNFMSGMQATAGAAKGFTAAVTPIQALLDQMSSSLAIVEGAMSSIAGSFSHAGEAAHTGAEGLEHTEEAAQGAAEEMGHASEAAQGLGAKIMKLIEAEPVIEGLEEAFEKLKETISEGIESYANYENVSAQTAAALRATGDAAGTSMKEIQEMAEAIEKHTGMSVENTQAGENMLLMFGNVKNRVGEGNDIFNQSVKAMADLSAHMGGDAVSAAQQLGEALNDPTNSARALQAEHILLSGSQQKMIADMTASGNVLGAQKVILDAVHASVGGAADMYGKTFDGALGKLKGSWEDLNRSMVASAMPGLTLAVNDLATEIFHLADVVKEGGISKMLEEVFGPVTQAAIIGTGAAITIAAIPPLLAFASAFGAVVTGAEAAEGAQVGLAAASGTAVAEMLTAWAPIVAAGVVIGAIAYEIESHWSSLSGFFSGLFGGIQSIAGDFARDLQSGLGGAMEALGGAIVTIGVPALVAWVVANSSAMVAGATWATTLVSEGVPAMLAFATAVLEQGAVALVGLSDVIGLAIAEANLYVACLVTLGATIIRDGVASMVAWVASLGPAIVAGGVWVGELLGGAIPAITATGAAIMAAAVPAITAFVGALGSFVLAAAPFVAVGALIGAVAYEIYEHWDTVKTGMIGVWNALIGALHSFYDDFRAVWNAVASALGPVADSLGAQFKGFGQMASAAFAPIVASATSTWDSIKGSASSLETTVTSTIERYTGAVGVSFSKMAGAAKEPTNKLTDSVGTGVASAGKSATDAAAKTAQQIDDIYAKLQQDIKTAINVDAVMDPGNSLKLYEDEAKLVEGAMKSLAEKGVGPLDDRLKALKQELQTLNLNIDTQKQQAAINDVNKAFDEYNASQKLIAAQAADTGTSFDALGSQIDALKVLLQRLKKDGIDESSDRFQDFSNQLKLVTAEHDAQDSLSELSKQASALGPSFDLAGASIPVFQKELKGMIDSGVASADAIGTLQTKLETANLGKVAFDAANGFQDLATQAKVLGPSFDATGEAVKVYSSELEALMKLHPDTVAGEAALREQLTLTAQNLQAAQVAAALAGKSNLDLTVSIAGLVGSLEQAQREAAVLGSSFDVQGATVQALQGELKTLADAGYGPASSEVKSLQAALASAQTPLENYTAATSVLQTNLTVLQGGLKSVGDAIGITFSDPMSAGLQKALDFGKGVSQVVTSLSGFAEQVISVLSPANDVNSASSAALAAAHDALTKSADSSTGALAKGAAAALNASYSYAHLASTTSDAANAAKNLADASGRLPDLAGAIGSDSANAAKSVGDLGANLATAATNSSGFDTKLPGLFTNIGTDASTAASSMLGLGTNAGTAGNALSTLLSGGAASLPTQLDAIQGASAAASTATGAITTAMGGAATASGLLSGALGVLSGPVGIIATVVLGGVAAVSAYAKSVSDAQQASIESLNDMTAAAQASFEAQAFYAEASAERQKAAFDSVNTARVAGQPSLQGLVAGLQAQAAIDQAAGDAAAKTADYLNQQSDAIANNTKEWSNLMTTMTNGLNGSVSGAIKNFLSGGNSLVSDLRTGIENAVIGGITSALMQQTLFSGMLQPLLDSLSKDLVAGNNAGVSSMIGEISAAIPGITNQLTSVLTPIQSALTKAFAPSLNDQITPILQTQYAATAQQRFVAGTLNVGTANGLGSASDLQAQIGIIQTAMTSLNAIGAQGTTQFANYVTQLAELTASLNTVTTAAKTAGSAASAASSVGTTAAPAGVTGAVAATYIPIIARAQSQLQNDVQGTAQWTTDAAALQKATDDAMAMQAASLPQMASGGLFSGATNITIGEAGPEAALPLNTSVFARIASGIVSAMPPTAAAASMILAPLAMPAAALTPPTTITMPAPIAPPPVQLPSLILPPRAILPDPIVPPAERLLPSIVPPAAQLLPSISPPAVQLPAPILPPAVTLLAPLLPTQPLASAPASLLAPAAATGQGQGTAINLTIQYSGKGKWTPQDADELGGLIVGRLKALGLRPR